MRPCYHAWNILGHLSMSCGDRRETGSMEDLNAIVLNWEALNHHRPKGHLKHPCSFSLHLPVVPWAWRDGRPRRSHRPWRRSTWPSPTWALSLSCLALLIIAVCNCDGTCCQMFRVCTTLGHGGCPWILNDGSPINATAFDKRDKIQSPCWGELSQNCKTVILVSLQVFKFVVTVSGHLFFLSFISAFRGRTQLNDLGLWHVGIWVCLGDVASHSPRSTLSPGNTAIWSRSIV